MLIWQSRARSGVHHLEEIERAGLESPAVNQIEVRAVMCHSAAGLAIDLTAMPAMCRSTLGASSALSSTSARSITLLLKLILR